MVNDHSDNEICVWLSYCEGNKGNVLFNDALNTFYLRLYGVRHMVKDNSDSERGNQTAAIPPWGLIQRPTKVELISQ